RGGHDGVGRKLVVRGDVDRPDPVCLQQRHQRVDLEPLVVHRERLHVHAGEPEGSPRPGIAQGLDGDDVTRSEQRAGHEIDRLLAPAGDHHVLRLDGEAAAVGQHGGEPAAEVLVAARVAVAEELPPVAAQGVPERAGEGRGREQPHVGGRAVQDQRAPGLGREDQRRRAGRRRDRIGGDPRRRGRSVHVLEGRERLLRDEGSATPPGLDQTLRHQLLVAGDDRVAVNAEQRGERARPRQRIARLETAAADVAGERLGELHEHRRAAAGVERGREQLPVQHRAGSYWSIGIRRRGSSERSGARSPLEALSGGEPMRIFTPLFVAVLAGCGASSPSDQDASAQGTASEELRNRGHESNNPNPMLFPKDARPYGRPMSRWAELTWSYIYGIAPDQNPFFDTTGEHCAVDQHGPVWFLPAVPGSSLGNNVTRACTIPRGRAIMLQMSSAINDYPCPDPSFHPAPGQSLYDFLYDVISPLLD